MARGMYLCQAVTPFSFAAKVNNFRLKSRFKSSIFTLYYLISERFFGRRSPQNSPVVA